MHQNSFAAFVRDARAAATDVVSMARSRPNGSELPSWQPGACVDVRLPSGRMRLYTLHGDAANPFAYRVAVLRIAEGRSGLVEPLRDTAIVLAL